MTRRPISGNVTSWEVGDVRYAGGSKLEIWAGSDFVPLASDTGARIWNDMMRRLRALEAAAASQDKPPIFNVGGGSLGGMS